MNRGVDFGTVFFDDVDYMTFARLCGQAHDEHGLDFHAYCFMGNHYHALAHDPAGNVSRAMQQLSSSYTRIVNERLGRDGPLFRGRFTSVLAENDEQLINTVAYIHRNPIDLVPVEAIPAYRWSSYPAYLGRATAPNWLSTALINDLLPIETHRDLVAVGIPDLGAPVSEQRITDALASIGPLPSTIRRSVALIISAEFGRIPTDELMRRFGFPSPAAAKMALSRARKQRSSDAEIARLVTDVERKLDVTQVSDTRSNSSSRTDRGRSTASA
jgi:REP element-mobilizing transposase RayT